MTWETELEELRRREALAEADRAHVRWFATRMDEMVTEASVRDLLSRQTELQKATVATNRRLLAALERARNARRPVIHTQPRVVYRVRTVFVSGGAR